MAVIVGSDKDLKRLVCGNVVMWDFRNVSGPEEVYASLGVRPEQVWDYLTIVGDAGDDVPGIKRLGEEAAKVILKDYGTLAEAMSHAHATPSKFYSHKYAKLLREGVDDARLSAKLVRLRPDAPLGICGIGCLRRKH